MSRAEERVAPDSQARSANERFRDRWEAQFRLSMMLAVAVHVAIFSFSPKWEARVQEASPSAWEGSRLLSLPFFGRAPSLVQAPATPLSLMEQDDETEAEPLLQEGAVVKGADRGDLWDDLGERLRRGGALVPTLARPEIEPEPAGDDDGEEEDAGSTADDRDDPAIGGDARMADLATLALQDSLRLDRLSALRPDLAFMAASAWVLIRNPVEVAAFMGRGYSVGTLDDSVSGTVAVTLWVDSGGSVEWAEISQSSGRPELDEYALELFNEVVDFRPARERGVAISRSVTLSLHFPW